jgi:hypothetical protein
MEDAIFTEKKDGLTLNIYRDEHEMSPDEDGDDGLFLVGYHRDFTVDRKVSQGLAQCIARGGKYEDDSENSEALDYIKKYHIFGLEAYIHSGVVLALSSEGNFPDRQWDVSQLGLVFASKKEWRMRKSARKAALGLIETWNDYLSGNVYGFVIEDEGGTHYDSCWGFSGDYEDNCLPEARAALAEALETFKSTVAGLCA